MSHHPESTTPRRNRLFRPTTVALLAAMAIAAGVVGAVEPMPPLKNLSQPEPGRYAAGAVTSADVPALQRAGIRHVIDLRVDTETPDFDEAAAIRGAGIGYYALPIAGPEALDRATVDKLDALLAASVGQPTLLHCGSSNRVGAVIALRAGWLQGLSTDAAIAEGRRWGLAGLESEVRRKLDDTGAVNP